MESVLGFVVYLVASLISLNFMGGYIGAGGTSPRAIVWALLLGWALIPISILWLIWIAFITLVGWLFGM